MGEVDKTWVESKTLLSNLGILLQTFYKISEERQDTRFYVVSQLPQILVDSIGKIENDDEDEHARKSIIKYMANDIYNGLVNKYGAIIGRVYWSGEDNDDYSYLTSEVISNMYLDIRTFADGLLDPGVQVATLQYMSILLAKVAKGDENCD